MRRMTANDMDHLAELIRRANGEGYVSRAGPTISCRKIYADG